MNLTNLLDYYCNLLAFEYRNKNKASATTRLVVKQALADAFAGQVASAYNIENAVGNELDIIGKYVGMSRQVATIAAQPWFQMGAYNQATPTDYPYGMLGYNGSGNDQGIFASYADVGASRTSLSDASYSKLLLLKIYTNHMDGTLSGIQNFLLDWFPYQIQVEDNKDMTLTYVLDLTFTIAPLNQTDTDSLLKNFLPRPLGVGINIVRRNLRTPGNRITQDGGYRILDDNSFRIVDIREATVPVYSGDLVREYTNFTASETPTNVPDTVAGNTLITGRVHSGIPYFNSGYINYGSYFISNNVNTGDYPYQMWGKESDSSIVTPAYTGNAWTTFEFDVNDIQPINWYDFYNPSGARLVTDKSGMLGGIMGNFWLGFLRGKLVVWIGNHADFVYWGNIPGKVLETGVDATPGKYRLAVRSYIYNGTGSNKINRIILSKDGAVIADYSVPSSFNPMQINSVTNYVQVSAYQYGWAGYSSTLTSTSYSLHATMFMAKYKLNAVRVWRGNNQTW